MDLESLLRKKRKIRVIGFDDAPFVRESKENAICYPSAGVT